VAARGGETRAPRVCDRTRDHRRISDDGYITESLEEIANTLRPEVECDAAEVEAALAGVQALDPPGIGARSVGECIELQLRQLDPATQDSIPHRDRPTPPRTGRGARALAATARTSCHRGRDHLRPGAGTVLSSASGSTVSTGAAEYVVPDVFVRRTDHGWAVEINSATCPACA